MVALRSTRIDPSDHLVTCEACGAVVRLGDSHSFVASIHISYATTGPASALGYRVMPVQCDAEQHFACSQACAVACAHACIDEHLAPKHSATLAAIAEYERKQQPAPTEQESAAS